MSAEELKKEMKIRNFKPYYLLYGEEAYLIRHYKKLLSEAILNGGNDMNFSTFSGKGINLAEVNSLAQTLPFFSEYRLILIEYSGLFSSHNEAAELLLHLPPSTILIFIDNEVDKRNKLYKQVTKQGLSVEFQREGEQNLAKWIKAYFSKNRLEISTDLALYLVERVGDSMDLLMHEMEKLLAFVHGKSTLEKSDIDLVCPETIQDRVFKLMDAIGKKDRETALEYYYDLLELREASLKILALIIRHFRLLKNIKKLYQEGLGHEAASLLKIPPFAVKNYVSQMDNFSSSTLKQALEYSLSLEYEIKRGLINEKIAVENIIIKYSK